MILPVVLFALPTAVFGVLVITLLIKQERIQKLLTQYQQLYKEKSYHSSVFSSLHNRLSHTLDIEKVVDVVVSNLNNFLPYSTASLLLVKNDQLLFKTYAAHIVSPLYLEEVKKNMLASLSAISGKPQPTLMKESIYGVAPTERNNLSPGSFFHIPLILDDDIVGIFSVYSLVPNLYQQKEKEITLLYKVLSQVCNGLSRLEDILWSEKGKIMAMMGSLSDGVFMVDTSSQIVFINDAAKSFLHLPNDKPRLEDIVLALPQDFDFSSKMQKAIEKHFLEEEIILGRKYLEIFMTPVYDRPKKNLYGVSVVIHDISLEKSLSETKEDFVNMTIHELRAPLTVIKGSSELMLSSQSLNPDEGVKLLRLINDQSKKLLNDVSEMLDAARLEAGRFTLNKAPTDLETFLLEKVDVFNTVAENKHIALVKHIDQDLGNVSIDKKRIEQVINNLVSNSLKHTQEGKAITVSAQKANGFVTISVQDTGEGIPKDEQSKLFSRYSTASSPTPSSQQSTGLGLYIAKGIVKMHGGTINLDSQEGKGTSVSFTLPLNSADTEELAQNPGEISLIPSETNSTHLAN